MNVTIQGPDYCRAYGGGILAPCFVQWHEKLSDSSGGESVTEIVDKEKADAFGVMLPESWGPPLVHDMPGVLTFGLIVDWARNIEALRCSAPFYDVLFVDGSGVEEVGRLMKGGVCREFVTVGNFGSVGSVPVGGMGPELVPWEDRKIDVSFVGNYTGEGYEHRFRWIESLKEAVDWDGVGGVMIGRDSGRLNVVIKDNVSAEDYVKIFGASRMVFNPTTDARQRGVNARNFEAAAMGCLLMYASDNLGAKSWIGSLGACYDGGHGGAGIRTAIDKALRDDIFSEGKAKAFARKCAERRGDDLCRELSGLLGKPELRVGDRRTDAEKGACLKIKPSWA